MIYKNKIKIPKNIDITTNSEKNIIYIKGPQGTLDLKISSNIIFEIKSDSVVLYSKENNKKLKKYVGLYSSLLKNNFKGVLQKFRIVLFLKGVGYKVTKSDNKLIFKLGYSHEVVVNIPKDLNVNLVGPTQFVIYGSDLSRLKLFASNIKRLRKVDPYKGKGILYKNEKIYRKEGKKN